MPKHTYWLTYLLDKFPALKANAHNLGTSFIGHEEPTYRSTEPVLTSLLYMVILTVIALVVRGRITKGKDAVIPSDKLDATTFFEIFVGYFYDLAKDVMGAKNAKRYFPIIGGSALFILFSNIIGLIPGVGSPTSSLNVTLGCALVVFVTFNYYGIKENGLGYFKHMMGPMLVLAPLIFLIEIVSTCVRPITLAVRLMVNIAVDHLLGALFLGLVALFVPIPFVLLGVLVCVVQTLVFCLLTTVYIGLATEHQEHESHGEGHGGEAHAH
ncbi:MAG TPA: F0F1 ATP synthase subunit A [Polyangiaceae bacterium]|jgi:F-type H+-transporting ATPase subunit a|nr:F0F1 ATP synthase subunit A [Polyangiaceae bacterium]